MSRENRSQFSRFRRFLPLSVGFLVLLMLLAAQAAQAANLVNDFWADGTDDDPASPVYSENGTDTDLDGDLESAWFQGGGGSLNPAGPNGPLEMIMDGGPLGSSSSSWTTYFTPEGSEANLSAPGQKLRVTWLFTTHEVNSTNTSQNFRIALVDSPGASRVPANGTPGNAAYQGYAIFGNMGETFGHAEPFELMERTNPAVSSALLSASGSWEDDFLAASGGTNGNPGYSDNTTYKLVMELTRTPANSLDITATITGGNVNGTGTMTVTANDATPQSFIYDTFALRPSSALTTTDQFDTHYFRVQVIIPEPASALMLALGALPLTLLRWRSR
jgi:hypothetical protein